MAKLLVCRPSFFDVVHKGLNIHMTMKDAVQKQKAMEQWKRLMHLLVDLKTDIKQVEQRDNMVDMVFAANGGLVHDNKAIIPNFTAKPRRIESEVWKHYLEENGYTTCETKHHFEGEGDALFSHNNNELWIGYGKRTDYESHAEIHKIFDVSVNSLKLVDDRFYHLDTCFLPLARNNLVYYPNAFCENSQQLIKSKYNPQQLIEVSEEDAELFTCNAINIWNVIIAHNPTETFEKQVNARGFKVWRNNMSEFLKSGGSAKCCVLRLDQSI